MKVTKNTLLACGLLVAVACGPKAKNMPAVYFSRTWDTGEVKTCVKPNDDNLLFCDLDVYESRIKEYQLKNDALHNAPIHSVGIPFDRQSK
jgi:hypothetical protein